VENGFGVSYAVYMVGEEVVGHAHGSATALPTPPGQTLQLLPWELDPLPPVPSLGPCDLDQVESRFVTNVGLAHERAQLAGTLVEDELLHFDWRPSAPGHAYGELAIGPEFGNRVGHLQGGALYAAGARTAAHAVGDVEWALVEGSYQFLRPGAGRWLMVRAEVLRRGRSAAFVQTHLSVDDVLIGAGLYTFCPAEKESA
jgi:acyl-coenzyme A thioesterase PaaI-like protein